MTAVPSMSVLSSRVVLGGQFILDSVSTSASLHGKEKRATKRQGVHNAMRRN